ncbi:MAG: CRISPR-associated protein Cas5 [Oscillospiraceae bacterium]|nr:CRISPR-associated protein Cas5 [Oscillospiraceae bacterium]
MLQKEYPIQLEIAGNTALWTRPDTGDSPVSYPAPTYGAVKGIFEAILWGPAVEIVPIKVEICAPLRYHSYATNYGGPLRNPQNIKKGDAYQLYATVLTDVCYRLYAVARPNPDKAKLPEAARQWDGRTTSPGHAYQEIFNRRLSRGQMYATVCLGWQEFTPSYFGPFRAETEVCKDVDGIVIPSMLRQTFSQGYQTSFCPSYDTDLVIRHGVLTFPVKGGREDDQ